MARIWTHGVWTAKPGREDDFVAEWRKLLSIAGDLGAGDPVLLRDRDRPNVFRSFGSWSDLETIERFRERILPRIGEMNDLLESFEPYTLDEVYPGE